MALSRAMDESSKQRKQERVFRAVQMSASSGFLDDNRSLQESCLALCNSCREYVPVPCLVFGLHMPYSLLAIFWPDIFRVGGGGDSRTLPFGRVLKVHWRFEAFLKTGCFLEVDLGEAEQEEEEEEEDEGQQQEEEKEKQCTKEKVKRDPVIAWHIDVSKVRWPEGVQTINLIHFDRPVDSVIWPASLEVLSFNAPFGQICRRYSASDREGIFNSPLDAVTFPAGLRELFLGLEFDQCIAGVAWPEGLEILSMSGFNQPIHDVQWPSGLKELAFIGPYQVEHRESSLKVAWKSLGVGFKQPLGTFLPSSLNKLWLSDDFDQSLRGVTWPSGLATLGLGIRVTEELIDDVAWPPSLRKLVRASLPWAIRVVPRGCLVVVVFDSAELEVDSDEMDLDQWDGYGGSGGGDVNYDSPMSDF